MPALTNDVADDRGINQAIDAGGYIVRIGAGLRHEFSALITDAAPAHHYAVVSDSNVAPLHAAALVHSLAQRCDGRTSLHVITAGEPNKTRGSWSRITDEMLDAGCGRDTAVVALGGGVVGDLAGFVAATYMRGIPVVQCPTSLLAMIDASVGGKTGVDTGAGKNLVGAFHPPAAVLADVELVSTLPLAHRRAGLAEAIKHGVIADEAYFAWIGAHVDSLLAADPASMAEIVAHSVTIKADVVRQDARESGRRKTLNFGHTLGHAIEHASGFELLHGDCVAIGMVLEARIAERIGVADAGLATQIEQLLLVTGLPVTIPGSVSIQDILDATRLDKKARGGQVEFALPVRLGTMAGETMGWGTFVPDDIVRATVA